MLNTALRFLVAVASAAILANAASAQAWPSKPITYIVPFAAGSEPDVLARNISSELATKFRQPFIVENRPGANGNIGAAAVSKADCQCHEGWPASTSRCRRGATPLVVIWTSGTRIANLWR